MTALEMQDCAPYRARLTVLSCAARHRKAQSDPFTNVLVGACKDCEVGKRNAGVASDHTVDNPNARDCQVCGLRFVPEQFTAYSNACGKSCRSVLQRGRDTTYKQRARAKRASKAKGKELGA